MALVSVTCSIPAGQSLSNGVVLTAGRLVRIRTPSSWQPANITCNARAPMCRRNIATFTGASAAKSSSVRSGQTVIALPSEVTAFLQDAWIKLRSGHAGIAVPQPSQCDFELVLFK
jgi:hypothetical protein